MGLRERLSGSDSGPLIALTVAKIVGDEIVGDVSVEPLPPHSYSFGRTESRVSGPGSVSEIDRIQHIKESVDKKQEHIEANREPLQIRTVDAADTHEPTVDFETAMYMRSQSEVPDNYGVAEVVDYEPDDTYDEVTVTMVLPDGGRGEITAIVGADRDDCVLAEGEYPLELFCKKCYNTDTETWVDLEYVDRLQGAVFLVAENEGGGYTSTEADNYRETLLTAIDEPADESDDTTMSFEPSNNVEEAVLAISQALIRGYPTAVRVVVLLVIIGIVVGVGLFLGL